MPYEDIVKQICVKLAHVMACCLTASNHQLNQCSKVFCGIYLRAIKREMLNISVLDTSLNITNSRLQQHFPGPMNYRSASLSENLEEKIGIYWWGQFYHIKHFWYGEYSISICVKWVSKARMNAPSILNMINNHKTFGESGTVFTATSRLAYPRPDPNHKIHDLKPYNFAPNHTIFWSNHILFQTIQLSF